MNGNLEIFELFNHPLINDERDRKGFTPLHIACQYGNLDIIKEILKDSSIDINDNDNEDEQTPLHCACDNGGIEIILFLLKQKDIIPLKQDKYENPPWHYGMDKSHKGIFEIFFHEF